MRWCVTPAHIDPFFAGGSHVALRSGLRKVLFASAAGVIALMLANTYQAAAITNGRPDGNGHPYVGLRLLNVAGHDVAVAIVSTGGGHFCAGANPNFNYRLDTPSAQAFLSQFVT